MSLEMALGMSGALILVLFGVIGFMLRQDRKGIAESIKAGFDEVKALIAAIDTRQRQIDKDCVTWADLNEVKAKVLCHETEIAVIKTTCANEHGK